MARAVFQVRSPHVQDIDVNTGEDEVSRRQSKSLSLSEKTTSLISCLHQTESAKGTNTRQGSIRDNFEAHKLKCRNS